MANSNIRKFPVGIQSFTEIREQGFLYVDKTDIVWNLVNNGKKYNYLSRPRRFGKSVLVDTLQAYLEGRHELFEGLRIMQMEKDWTNHPVVRLDMSSAGAEPESIRAYLDDAFHQYEKKYNVEVRQLTSLAVRLKNIIATAYEKTGHWVVCLLLSSVLEPVTLSIRSRPIPKINSYFHNMTVFLLITKYFKPFNESFSVYFPTCCFFLCKS